MFKPFHIFFQSFSSLRRLLVVIPNINPTPKQVFYLYSLFALKKEIAGFFSRYCMSSPIDRVHFPAVPEYFKGFFSA